MISNINGAILQTQTMQSQLPKVQPARTNIDVDVITAKTLVLIILVAAVAGAFKGKKELGVGPWMGAVAGFVFAGVMTISGIWLLILTCLGIKFLFS